MKYLFYLIFSKVGIIFSGSGRLRLNSALSTFTKAKEELYIAIDHELQSIKKNDVAILRVREEFKRKEKKLSERTEEHIKTHKESSAYLTKIEDFLRIDEDSNNGVSGCSFPVDQNLTPRTDKNE